MMTKKQKAARIRNWKLLQLKSVLSFLRPYLSQYTLGRIESIVKNKIDRQWEIDKL